MATFDCATCHNINTSKLNNHNEIKISKKSNFHKNLFQVLGVKFSFVQMSSCK